MELIWCNPSRTGLGKQAILSRLIDSQPSTIHLQYILSFLAHTSLLSQKLLGAA
jgi:hypothetical protein